MARTSDQSTPITLSESAGVRYLHFGSPWVQGAMRVSRPETLVLEYVRQMMGWLLFLEPPLRILQLGLGAGSLARFTRKYCPQTRITAVEISSDVIDVACDWFALPRFDRELQLVRADAFEFLKRPASRQAFGIVQVDLYDMDALGPTLDTARFYRACRDALREPGICVINLFGEHHTFEPNIRRIEKAFDGRVLVLPAIPEGNRVVFAFSGPQLRVGWEQLTQRGLVLRQKFGLEADQWVRQIRGISGKGTEFAI